MAISGFAESKAIQIGRSFYDGCQIKVQNCQQWFLIIQYFYQMIQPSIPLTTIKRFIRNKINPSLNISGDFYAQVRNYSKNFIDALVFQILSSCEQKNKVKITPQIFYETLQKLGLGDMNPALQHFEQKLYEKKRSKKMNREIIAKNIERVYSLAEKEERNEKIEKQFDEGKVKLEMKMELQPIQLSEEQFRLEVDLTENDNENKEKDEEKAHEIL